MIEKILRFSLHHRVLIALLTAAVAAIGLQILYQNFRKFWVRV